MEERALTCSADSRDSGQDYYTPNMAESFYSQQATPGAHPAAAPQINIDAINGTPAQTQVCATSLLFKAVDT